MKAWRRSTCMFVDLWSLEQDLFACGRYMKFASVAARLFTWPEGITVAVNLHPRGLNEARRKYQDDSKLCSARFLRMVQWKDGGTEVAAFNVFPVR
jgi:hypothetical protein